MRDLWHYWRENLKRSLLSWERTEIIERLLLGLVSLLVALGILQDRFINAIPQLLGWTFLIWLGLLVFIITPARMWNAIRKEKEELEQCLEPKLAIISGNTPPFIDTGRCDEGEMCKTFRICIKNISEGQTVRNVKVALIEADPPLEFLPIPLHLMHDIPLYLYDEFKTTFDLHPKGKQYVDVFRCSEDPSKPTIGFISAVHDLPTIAAKQRYLLTIQATGQDVPDCKERFVVDVSSAGEVLFLPAHSCA